MNEKIFITLGSQKFQFNRLLIAVDKLCEKKVISGEDVFAQTGYSDYVPRNYSYNNFLDRDEFSVEMGKADIVITHGGTGAIIGAVKKGKKVIAVPRRAKYGEHVDDHQLQLIKQFDDLNLICPCRDAVVVPILFLFFVIFLKLLWERVVPPSGFLVFFFPNVVAVVNVQLVFFFKLCDAVFDCVFNFCNGLFHGFCPPFLVWFSLLSLCV